ncbi:MAG: hypothetical protein CEN92_159 [Candidatus Berkelbacteria bacterium Licking1014_96]|uniref:HEPN domain-containing protein n=1 Tax=Candidatus Berkelbacteria bacterium Licking1014_96 TaxID=2017149 RepID=A0A554LGR6_9BACT|nr:MAG: hypothetical protein CEN92_159 [Candidatus Berkelbacteria bacterium Licking1014_96]
MDKNNPRNYDEWLEKAHEDELAAIDLFKKSHLYAPACFHYQQLAEKYLKALLIYQGKSFLKVHDLISLSDLLCENYPEIKKLDPELKLLNRFYIETRYPGSESDFTLHDAQRADFASIKIKSFVLKIINQKN